MSRLIRLASLSVLATALTFLFQNCGSPAGDELASSSGLMPIEGPTPVPQTAPSLGGSATPSVVSHSFGQVALGSNRRLTLTIQGPAPGTAPVNVSIALAGSSLTLEQASDGAFTLAPGASRSVVLVFTASVGGAFAGTALVNSGGVIHTVSLSATVFAPAVGGRCTVYGIEIGIGQTAVRYLGGGPSCGTLEITCNPDQTIDVKNTGNLTLLPPDDRTRLTDVELNSLSNSGSLNLAGGALDAEAVGFAFSRASMTCP